MIIEVAKLKKDGERFRGEEPVAILELGNVEDVHAEKPVQYDLTANVAGRNLVVRGTVKVEMAFVCVRCAETVRMTVQDADFLSVVELGDDDESVNLTDDIRESIILAFPSKPLCSASCKGLCAGCGANLNRGECRCPPRAADGRWSALDGVKF